MFRRIAAHRVRIHGKELRMHVVEITDGWVTSCYPLSEEMPFTEWLGGTIDITTDETGRRTAVWQGKRMS